MMSKIIFGCLFSTALLFTLPSQAAYQDRIIATLCDFAKTNNRSAIRKKLKEARINLKAVYSAIQCPANDNFSGGTLLKTATFFGAEQVAKFFIIRLGTNGLKKIEDANFVEWTKNLLASGKVKNPEATQKILAHYQEKTKS